jgi:hypothetical protein
LRRTAFVSPTRYGHTVVFDKIIDEQHGEAVERLGEVVIVFLACAALAAMYYDDAVLYL